MCIRTKVIYLSLVYDLSGFIVSLRDGICRLRMIEILFVRELSNIMFFFF